MGCSGKGAAGRFTPCREEYLRLPDAKEADYGPCYWIPELPMPDDVVFLNQENIQSFLPDAFSWLAQEISYVLPCAAVIQNGQAVTICRSVRISNEAAEAGLETLFVYRGRGYARPCCYGLGKSGAKRGQNAALQHFIGIILLPSRLQKSWGCVSMVLTFQWGERKHT